MVRKLRTAADKLEALLQDDSAPGKKEKVAAAIGKSRKYAPGTHWTQTAAGKKKLSKSIKLGLAKRKDAADA
jgi:hypothetical protein